MPCVAKPLPRSDAGKLEDVRRADRARAQDHLGPGVRGFDPALMEEFDTGAAPALDHQPLDLRLGLHEEVGPPPCRTQEALGRGPAHAGFLGHLEVAAAFIGAPVEIIDFGNAALGRRLAEDVENFPIDPGRLDPPLAAGAVELVLALPVILGSLEVGQDVVPAPAGIAELAPVIVVARLPAHVDHAVDRSAPAQHLATGIVQHLAVQARLRLGHEAPVGARVAHRVEIADRDVDPDVPIVSTRFEQQHPFGGVGRETVGEHAARRPSPDDDVVEVACRIGHRSCSSCRNCSCLMGRMSRNTLTAWSA